jgi:excinuclease UvrABC nuclease subunit
MINDKDYKAYLDYLINNFISKGKLGIILNRAWSQDFYDAPGVYFFEKNNIVYVGETTSIKERMRDILDTRHHTLRRKIGALNFSEITGYKRANSKSKFIPLIEELVSEWMIKRMKFSFVRVSLGRKELEELIIKRYNPKYNSVSKRGNKLN